MPHVRNGVKYNDEQYLVKLARPADVIAEPLYANNKPEHYAVSNANTAALLQDSEGGAVGGRCPSPLPNDKVIFIITEYALPILVTRVKI